MARPLLNRSERQTKAALHRALADLGFEFTYGARTIDVLEHAADHPYRWKDTPGLRHNDVSYAFRSHFDITVLNPQLEPVLAVEFDGPHHDTPEQQKRDEAKNRLCAAAELPLLRVDDRTLQVFERTQLIEWLVRLWQHYEHDMPTLIDERNDVVAEMPAEELDDPALLAGRPDLDVEFIFELQHPFPPAVSVAHRLHAQHQLHVLDLDMPEDTSRCNHQCRALQAWPLPELDSGGSTVRYVTETYISRTKIGVGRYEAAAIYPLGDVQGGPSVLTAMSELFGGLPAGPWFGAAQHLSRGMSIYNALLDTEQQLQ